MAIEEGAWEVCVCISYTGDGGQLGCSFLWSRRGGWGGQGLIPYIKQITRTFLTELFPAFQSVVPSSSKVKRCEDNHSSYVITFMIVASINLCPTEYFSYDIPKHR